jgi:WD40 repeat protein
MPRPERPLDDSNDVLAGFAGDLRQLRETAGSPRYRELARRAHYSASTLSEAASGKRLPSLEVTLAYVRACDGDIDEWETRWREVAAKVTSASKADDTGEAPYAGLRSLGPRDAHRFHGRDRLLARLDKAVHNQRLVIAVGASGAGKSSLLRAGLVAAARSGALTGGHPWPDVVITPGSHPLESCAVGLAAHLPVPSAELHATLTEHPRALALGARQILAGHDDSTELLVVVDQFEEIFTLCRHDDERDRFVDQLTDTAADPICRTRIVLGVRADFYGHCARYPSLATALQEAQVLVGPMTSDELREAITQPAAETGCRVETALVSRLVAEATGQPGALPLLSHALLETWRRRHGTTLTLSAYEATGGIQNAIAHTAETAYEALNAEQQRTAAHVFPRLVALGEGTEDTKRRLPRTEIDDMDPVVLERLAAARLLVLDETGIEITHEALIRSWPRLRGWLAADRDGLRLHRQLTEATTVWEHTGRDEGALYRGVRLAAADDWAMTHADALTTRERQFLDTSRAVRDRDEAATRRRTRRLRQLVALLAVLFLLASATTVYAVLAESTATEQRNIALSQKVAGEAATLRDTRPALAAQLALAAYRLTPTEAARGTLISTFATPFSTQLLGHTNNLNAVAFAKNGKLVATAASDSLNNAVRLWAVADRHRPVTLAVITGHADNVFAVAFSPDGRVLATGSEDHTVRLWDVTNPRRPTELALLHTGAGRVAAVAFSPDGRTLAAVSSDEIIRLWPVTDRDAGTPQEIGGHTDDIISVAFSPDGRTLATSARDNTVRLWDITAQPRELRTIPMAPSHSDAVAFSPDGRTLAAVTNEPENSVRLWDVTDLRNPIALAPLTGHTDALRTLAFSPDGRMLATAGADRTVRLWDVADPRRPHSVITLNGHTDVVVSVAFSPDGRTLATASDDDTARLWDLPGPLVASHPDDVCGVKLTADGKTLVSGSKDGTVLLTDLAGEATNLTGHTDGACGAALTPNGRTLITGSWDGTVRRWDITDRRKPGAPETIAQHQDEIDAVALSPDGHTLAVASDRYAVQLLDIDVSGPPRFLATLTGHTDDIHAIAFNRTGNLLATTSWDHTVKLWNVSEPRRPVELAVLTGHGQAVLAVTFSPDGRTLVTSSPDRTIRLWNITDPRAPYESARLNGHTDTAQGLAFSPDGRTLATASNDHTARLWDVTNPEEPRESAVLTGHTDRVRTVAFGPDGHTLVTGSTDQTVRVWETDPERVAARVCAVAYPPITPRQWEQYLPGIDYRPPC